MPTDLQLTIFNQIGQQLLTENWRQFQKGSIDVPTDNLPDGMYFLNLSTNKEQVTRTFFVSGKL